MKSAAAPTTQASGRPGVHETQLALGEEVNSAALRLLWARSELWCFTPERHCAFAVEAR